MSVEDIDRVGDEEGRTKIQTKGITFKYDLYIELISLLYSGKLSREKTFVGFGYL